jgi:hypothetical protein
MVNSLPPPTIHLGNLIDLITVILGCLNAFESTVTFVVLFAPFIMFCDTFGLVGRDPLWCLWWFWCMDHPHKATNECAYDK